MPQSSSHEYRPDIDGLRAVAVILVIIFHATPDLLPGGLIGVDVFFVISGYLITSIILRESRASTFTLVSFYTRRCRRILPALIVVLAATWAIGYVALPDDDFRQVGKHVLGGSTFTSNLLLWRETGYFDISAIRKPLLHLWSLGVEEQFYLFWPPLMLLLIRRGWRPLPATAIMLIGSLALATAMLPAHDAATFYLLPTRVWELLAGAVLVQTEWRTRPTADNDRGTRREWKAAVGLMLIAGASLFDPGIGRARIAWLAAPVVGAALLIAARDSWINRNVLARRAVVLIGLISFPLYLWHWPLLSVVTVLSEHATLFQIGLLKSAVVVLAFVLAWLTWYGVERPVRRFASPPTGERLRRNQQVLALSACVLAAMSLVGWRTWDRQRPDRRIAIDAGDLLLDGEALFPGSPFQRVSGADAVVLLLGDSHADHLIPGLVPEARKHGFGISHVGFGGCAGFRFSVRLWAPPWLFDRCQAIADSTLARFLPDPAVKVIVLAARGALYSTGREEGAAATAGFEVVGVPRDTRLRVLQEGYEDAIRRIESAGKRVVLALDVPELDIEPSYCVSRFSVATLLGNQCVIDRRRVDNRQRDYRDVVRRLQTEFPRLAVFDPLPLLCDSRWCYAKRNGLLLYQDRNHLSAAGSVLVGESLATLLFGRAGS